MNIIPDNFFVKSEIQNEVLSFLKDWYSEAEFIQVQTSGSTGKPKLIELKKLGMRFSAKNTIQFFKLTEDSKALLCLPLSTIGGKMMVVRALESNMKLIAQPATLNPLLKVNENIDFIAVTPMQLSYILEQSPREIHQIKSILVGGGAISETLNKQLILNKISVFHGFGMTETASHIAIRKMGWEGDLPYRALPGITFEAGEDQELIIHFPNLQTDPIITTDRIRLLNKNEFEWIGRLDFVINSGGIKVHPEEIEKKLNEFIPFPFFIIGMNDEKLGQKVILFIESNANKLEIDFSFLNHSKPREIIYLDKFVYTGSGKIDRIKTLENFRKEP